MSPPFFTNISRLLRYLIVVVALLCVSSAFAYNDSIVLVNNDHVVGELKNMSKNEVSMKTIYSNEDFKIKWHRVREIYSSRFFIFTFSNGRSVKGVVRTNKNDTARVIISGDGEDVDAMLIDIIHIKAIEGNFRGSFDAAIDLGYSFTKENKHHQLNINSDFRYRTEIYMADASYNVSRSKQIDTLSTKRTDGSLGLQFFLRKNWFLTLSSDFLQSDELKLKLRVTTKPGIGKHFFSNNTNYLNGTIGFAWNNEKYTDPEQEVRNSLELFLGPEYELFKIADFRILSNFTWYPSITEWGRHRFDFKVDLKYDLPLDFYIKASYTQNYDNKPVEGASSNDNIVQLNFGWDFNK